MMQTGGRIALRKMRQSRWTGCCAVAVVCCAAQCGPESWPGLFPETRLLACLACSTLVEMRPCLSFSVHLSLVLSERPLEMHMYRTVLRAGRETMYPDGASVLPRPLGTRGVVAGSDVPPAWACGLAPKAQLSSCPSPVVDRRPSYCDRHHSMHPIDLCSIRQMSVFH